MEKLRIVGAAIIDPSPGPQRSLADVYFSLNQIVEITGIDRVGIRRILEKFQREGLVIQVRKGTQAEVCGYEEKAGRPTLSIIYRVKAKKGLAMRIGPKQRPDTAQDKMWSVIRNKDKTDGNFTVRDLVVLGEVKRENARWYLKQLRRAGIVSCNGKGGPGVSWTLVKDCGPKRPVIGLRTE